MLLKVLTISARADARESADEAEREERTSQRARTPVRAVRYCGQSTPRFSARTEVRCVSTLLQCDLRASLSARGSPSSTRWKVRSLERFSQRARKSAAHAEKKGSGHDLLDGRRLHARNRADPGASPLPHPPFRAAWISPAYRFTSRLRFIS